jgi:hypothetical protein
VGRSDGVRMSRDNGRLVVEVAVDLAVSHVELRVHFLRDGLNVRLQLLLDAAQIVAVLEGDEVDRNAQMTETSRSSDTMQIGLRVTREVKVDDHIHRLNVNAASEQVGAHEIAAIALTEVMEDPIAMLLCHLRVDVVAGVAELRVSSSPTAPRVASSCRR